MSALQVTLNDLKTALRLDGTNITQWAKTLRNPEDQPVDRTNVYKAINHSSPQWLVDEIIQKVRQSRKDYPDYWEKQRP